MKASKNFPFFKIKKTLTPYFVGKLVRWFIRYSIPNIIMDKALFVGEQTY